MPSWRREALEAAKLEREAKLTTVGRTSGHAHVVTVWVATDGKRLFIRSGGGLTRHWPQNLLARGEGEIQLGTVRVKVKPRLVTDPAEARAASMLLRKKYGSFVKPSRPNQPLTKGETATFELLPAEA